MPTKSDNDEERERGADQLVDEQRKAEALKEQSELLKDRARRAQRQAKAALDNAEQFAPKSPKRRA